VLPLVLEEFVQLSKGSWKYTWSKMTSYAMHQLMMSDTLQSYPCVVLKVTPESTWGAQRTEYKLKRMDSHILVIEHTWRPIAIAHLMSMFWSRWDVERERRFFRFLSLGAEKSLTAHLPFRIRSRRDVLDPWSCRVAPGGSIFRMSCPPQDYVWIIC
jgi:hypothetical protein